MAAVLPTSRRRRLVRRLLRVERTLVAWERSLEHARTLEVNGGARPAAVPCILGLVSETRHALEQRLAQLMFWGNPSAESAITDRVVVKQVSWRSIGRMCLRACRCCGRALGEALRVARSVADEATVRLLFRAVRSFEKQLWVLDPRFA